MFESDIEEKVQNINLFEVVYKKDSFVLGGKEYPVGYTSFLAIKSECRFIDEKLFKALLDIHDELLDDFTRENLDYYHKGIEILKLIFLQPYEVEGFIPTDQALAKVLDIKIGNFRSRKNRAIETAKEIAETLGLKL